MLWTAPIIWKTKDGHMTVELTIVTDLGSVMYVSLPSWIIGTGAKQTLYADVYLDRLRTLCDGSSDINYDLHEKKDLQYFIDDHKSLFGDNGSENIEITQI
jgi:hypothetical protein